VRRAPPEAGAELAGGELAGGEFAGGALAGGALAGGALAGGALAGGALAGGALAGGEFDAVVSPSILYILDLDFIGALLSEPYLATPSFFQEYICRQNVRENIQATKGVAQGDPANTR
jgi:hypothetical protein